MRIFKAGKDDLSFVALTFSDEGEEAKFVRLLFILDELNPQASPSQYEILLELNCECWMGAYAIDRSTSSVLYVFNLPLEGFDAEALAVAVETFKMAKYLYQEAVKG
ncbi:MAG: hypothetical protein A2Y63_00660 [Candidatus Riflebacteria bacterium RBG_13_59_9]|nr:MAG: hypothetical protein A2Y63_00660 [Candidatus Riflebacteria bacterium RBG_13_59_9]